LQHIPQTNVSGEYTFGELAPGNYQLIALAQGFGETSVGQIRVGRDETLTVPSLELKFGKLPVGDCSTDDPSTALMFLSARSDQGAFQGVVRLSDGKPLSLALITVFASGSGQVAAVRADDSGRFLIPGLKPRHGYMIEVKRSGVFTEQWKDLSVQVGFATTLEPLTLESCKPGYCQPNLKEVRVLPGCA
jgi:hypothetical protein